MSKPKERELREVPVMVRLTGTEYERLERAAQACGLALSAYLRTRALEAESKEREHGTSNS